MGTFHEYGDYSFITTYDIRAKCQKQEKLDLPNERRHSYQLSDARETVFPYRDFRLPPRSR